MSVLGEGGVKVLVAVFDGWLLELVVGAAPVDFLLLLVLVETVGSIFVGFKLVRGWCRWGRVDVVLGDVPGSGGFGLGLGLGLGGCFFFGFE